jgi:hypothetical protein
LTDNEFNLSVESLVTATEKGVGSPSFVVASVLSLTDETV